MNKSFDPEETWERSDEQTYPFNSVISFGLILNSKPLTKVS